MMNGTTIVGEGLLVSFNRIIKLHTSYTYFYNIQYIPGKESDCSVWTVHNSTVRVSQLLGRRRQIAFGEMRSERRSGWLFHQSSCRKRL